MRAAWQFSAKVFAARGASGPRFYMCRYNVSRVYEKDPFCSETLRGTLKLRYKELAETQRAIGFRRLARQSVTRCGS